MKLLIITQKVDISDPILGFFHRWIEEFSKHVESLMVICLYEGEHHLPSNVKVLSLGKEKGVSRLKYILNFYKYIFSERKNYDKVFVHMNQEYILLGWKMWKLLGKDIYMWRNHHSGTLLTDSAVFFCKKVFCTSKFSYTAKFKKTVLMPVGVDLENFKPQESINRIPQSILSLGRISPSKHLDLLVDVINEIHNPKILVNIYGDPLSEDEAYYKELKEKAGNNITFNKGIPNIKTVAVYSTHDIFVNLSSSGMYDKTIFEAMACGCIILASNDNLRGQINDDFIFKQGDARELKIKLETLLKYSFEQRLSASKELRNFAEKHSLKKLAHNLITTINN